MLAKQQGSGRGQGLGFGGSRVLRMMGEEALAGDEARCAAKE